MDVGRLARRSGLIGINEVVAAALAEAEPADHLATVDAQSRRDSAIGGIALGVAPVAPAHAEPGCVYQDGTPCTPPAQGCVLPENQLPCSSQLQDINAAIRQQLGQVLGGVLG